MCLKQWFWISVKLHGIMDSKAEQELKPAASINMHEHGKPSLSITDLNVN